MLPSHWQQRFDKVRTLWHKAARFRYAPWIAASVLLLDIYAVSSASDNSHFPVCGCCCMFAMGKVGRHPYLHNGSVNLEGDKLRVVSKYESSSKQQEHVLALFFIKCDTTSVGLVAPVLKSRHHTIHITSLDGNSTAPPGNYRTIILDAIATHPDFQQVGPEQRALLTTGDGTKVSIMWPGLIHDALFVLGVVFLIHSCKFAAERQSANQLITSSINGTLRCTACSYNIRGLATKGVTHCPECGEPLSLTRALNNSTPPI